MVPVLDRIFARRQGTGRWTLPLAALLAVFALLALPWLRPDPAPQEAAAQEATSPETTSQAPPSPASAESTPSALDDLEFPFGDSSASAQAAEETEGLSGVGAVEVMGNLENIVAEGEFYCEGPSPDGDLVLWACAHSSGRYLVEVTADDPLTVFAVTATAFGIPERDTEDFFGRVLSLSLEDSAALGTEAWVSGAVPSGGRTFSGEAEISVYGTDASRAMSVVSTDAFLD